MTNTFTRLHGQKQKFIYKPRETATQFKNFSLTIHLQTFFTRLTYEAVNANAIDICNVS